MRRTTLPSPDCPYQPRSRSSTEPRSPTLPVDSLSRYRSASPLCSWALFGRLTPFSLPKARRGFLPISAGYPAGVDALTACQPPAHPRVTPKATPLDRPPILRAVRAPPPDLAPCPRRSQPPKRLPLCLTYPSPLSRSRGSARPARSPRRRACTSWSFEGLGGPAASGSSGCCSRTENVRRGRIRERLARRLCGGAVGVPRPPSCRCEEHPPEPQPIMTAGYENPGRREAARAAEQVYGARQSAKEAMPRSQLSRPHAIIQLCIVRTRR